MVRLEAQNVSQIGITIASTTIVTNSGQASALRACGCLHQHRGSTTPSMLCTDLPAFYYNGIAPAGTSDQAAAVAAAHRVLVNYFSGQQADLDAAFSRSSNAIMASAQR